MKHILSLDIPHTNNTQIFRILDTSIYSNDLPVKCGTLSITSPGFTVPVMIEVDENFNEILNACKLGISNQGCEDEMPNLPDGIYVVNYSVSPNNKVYVEYNYLRITQTLNQYYQELCRLEISSCEPSSDVRAKLKELRLIKSFLDAAKAKVEYCNSPHQGMQIFLFAKKLLDKYTSSCNQCSL